MKDQNVASMWMFLNINFRIYETWNHDHGSNMMELWQKVQSPGSWLNPDRTGHLNARFHRSLTSRAAFLNTKRFWYVYVCLILWNMPHAYCCKDLVWTTNGEAGNALVQKNPKTATREQVNLEITFIEFGSTWKDPHYNDLHMTFTWLHQKRWSSHDSIKNDEHRWTSNNSTSREADGHVPWHKWRQVRNRGDRMRPYATVASISHVASIHHGMVVDMVRLGWGCVLCRICPCFQPHFGQETISRSPEDDSSRTSNQWCCVESRRWRWWPPQSEERLRSRTWERRPHSTCCFGTDRWIDR